MYKTATYPYSLYVPGTYLLPNKAKCPAKSSDSQRFGPQSCFKSPELICSYICLNSKVNGDKQVCLSSVNTLSKHLLPSLALHTQQSRNAEQHSYSYMYIVQGSSLRYQMKPNLASNLTRDRGITINVKKQNWMIFQMHLN